jgi:type II secretory pathway pseudopilin PulG
MMRADLRRHARAGDAESGFTLVEQLVVMVLSAMIGTAVLSVTITGLRSQTRVDAHQTSLEQTRVALQRVSREIRDIAPGGIIAAFDNELVIAQDRGAQAYRTLDYAIASSGGSKSLVLVQKDYAGGTSCNVRTMKPSLCSSSSQRTTTVLPSLANAGTDAVFRYTPRAGYTSATASVNPATCAWPGQTASQYAQDCPGYVTIHLEQLVSGASTTTPTDLTAEVDLRNQS